MDPIWPLSMSSTSLRIVFSLAVYAAAASTWNAPASSLALLSVSNSLTLPRSLSGELSLTSNILIELWNELSYSLFRITSNTSDLSLWLSPLHFLSTLYPEGHLVIANASLQIVPPSPKNMIGSEALAVLLTSTFLVQNMTIIIGTCLSWP